jgi:tetratricopeptide (TPR) repeat protein
MHEILSCLVAQAELLMEEQDYPEALAILELVEEMSERVSSFPTLIQSNLDLANLYFQLGDFWQAETSLNAAFEPAKRQEVLPVVARCLLIAATLFAARGAIPEARRQIETTRQICKQKQLPLAQQITEVSKLIDAQEVMTNLPPSSAPPPMSSKEVLGYLTEVRWLLQ